MFSSVPYDTRSSAVYVFTHIIILKLKSFVVKNVLFYNMLVCDIGMPQCIVNIREYHEEIDKKMYAFILNRGI